MQRPQQPDQMTEGGVQYTYRDDRWTTGTGYCVSTTYGHTLTLKFYQENGRSPLCEPKPKSRRRRAV